MAVFQIKKYKIIKDESGNKVQVQKSKEEWNKETKNGTATWYFVDRYEINGIKKQYKSALFVLKREAEADNALFKLDPIKYIQEHSKRAKNKLKEENIDNIEHKTLNEYFEDYKIYYSEYVREGTIYNQEKLWIKHIKTDLGDLTPQQLDLKKIKLWHKKANKKINPKTNKIYSTSSKNTWHAVLVDFLEYLASDKLIEFNYAKTAGCFKKLNINKNETKKIKYQTEEEFNLFMSIVDDFFWYKVFNFLFWHGPRKGEQRAIKISDIILETDSVTFDKTFSRSKNGGEIIGPIKNGKSRGIYLAKQSKPYIEELINFYKNMDGYSEDWFVFGGPKAVYKNRIEDKLKYYYNKLEKKYPEKKINRLTHHEFGRHSHASYLLEEGLKKGLPIEQIYSIIATRLGDTIEVIKRTYAHLYEKGNNDKAKNILD